MVGFGLRTILALILAASMLIASRPQGHGLARESSQLAAPAASRYLVLIVLDGARPGYFHLTGIPHIKALIRRGTEYVNAWAGILESETPSGHATISTGSEPQRSGILSFSWLNGKRAVVNLFSPARIRSGLMERIMRASGAPTIAGLIHKARPGAKVVALSASKYYAADALGGPDADAIMYYAGRPDGMYAPTAIPGHVPPATVFASPYLTAPSHRLPLSMGDHLAMKLAVRTFRKMRPRVMLINLPEFDWPLGHLWGGGLDPGHAAILMQSFDRDLAMLERAYRQAGVLKRTVFVLTADHGMAPIYHHLSRSLLTTAASQAGTTVQWNAYHTAAYLWLRDETRAEATAAHIMAQRNPYIQSVYYLVRGPAGPYYIRAGNPSFPIDTGTDAANQYLLRTFDGPNAPDVAVFCAEGSAFVGFGQDAWKGDHGGADWQSQHVPLVLAGPGIRPGHISHYPARLEDIAPTALTLLGITPTGMQGIPLSDGLLHPPAWARSAQQRTGLIVRPVVTALRNEARREFAAGR